MWGVIQGRHKFELKVWKPILRSAFQTQSSLFLDLLIYSSFLWYSLAASHALATVPDSWDTKANKPKSLLSWNLYPTGKTGSRSKEEITTDGHWVGKDYISKSMAKDLYRLRISLFSLLSTSGMLCFPGNSIGEHLKSVSNIFFPSNPNISLWNPLIHTSVPLRSFPPSLIHLPQTTHHLSIHSTHGSMLPTAFQKGNGQARSHRWG